MAKREQEFSRENIHTGVSNLRVDAKWSDVLNFRFCNSRTRLLPPLVCKMSDGIGFHTLIRGPHNSHYLIGSEKSFQMRDFCGELQVNPLWELCHKFEGSRLDRDSWEYQLLVQGRYTGKEPKCLTVTLIDTEPEFEIEPDVTYCGGNPLNFINFINLDFEEGAEGRTGFIDHDLIPGWESELLGILEISPLNVGSQGTAHSGTRFLEVNSTDTDIVSQTADANIVSPARITMIFRTKNRVQGPDSFNVKLECVDTGYVVFDEEYRIVDFDWQEVVVFDRAVPIYTGPMKLSISSRESGSVSVHVDNIELRLS